MGLSKFSFIIIIHWGDRGGGGEREKIELRLVNLHAELHYIFVNLHTELHYIYVHLHTELHYIYLHLHTELHYMNGNLHAELHYIYDTYMQNYIYRLTYRITLHIRK